MLAGTPFAADPFQPRGRWALLIAPSRCPPFGKRDKNLDRMAVWSSPKTACRTGLETARPCMGDGWQTTLETGSNRHGQHTVAGDAMHAKRNTVSLSAGDAPGRSEQCKVA